jgi:hypothetical protein
VRPGVSCGNSTALLVKEDAVTHVPQLGKNAGSAGWIRNESEAIRIRCGPRHRRLAKDKLTRKPDSRIAHMRVIGRRAAPADIEGAGGLHERRVQESEERVGDVEEIEEL